MNEQDEKTSSPEAAEAIRQLQEQLDNQPQRGQRYIKPIAGYTWNPLRNLPRNIPCPCQSKKKFKSCCLNRLPLTVPIAAANDYMVQMSKPDLVFLTPENQQQILNQAQDKISAEKKSV